MFQDVYSLYVYSTVQYMYCTVNFLVRKLTVLYSELKFTLLNFLEIDERIS